jgi:hypothetical protein
MSNDYHSFAPSVTATPIPSHPKKPNILYILYKAEAIGNSKYQFDTLALHKGSQSTRQLITPKCVMAISLLCVFG